MLKRVALSALLLCLGAGAQADVLSVGPGMMYARPSQAAAAVKDGDTVEIASGTYSGDVAIWRANRITVRGVGTRPVLDAAGQAAEQKGLWVIKGANYTVENLEFTGAAVADLNGAGIRQEGDNLTVRNCVFHDNEDGILGGGGPASDVLIENSEFRHNGHGDGYSHNMYIGHVHSFTLRGCWSHDTKEGHNVKSRAAISYLLYNRISNNADSTSSMCVDLPNGGRCILVGNIIQHGASAHNPNTISFAEEGATNPMQELYLANNSVINDKRGGLFVRVAGQPTALKMVNNVFCGEGALPPAATAQNGNRMVAREAFRNIADLDVSLKQPIAAVAAGVAGGFDLTAKKRYVPPFGTKPLEAPAAMIGAP